MNGALGGIVGGEARPRPQSGGRADIDDRPAALLAENGHDRLAGEEDPLHIDRKEAVVFGLVDLQHRFVDVSHAGIVDEDVERPEGGNRFADHAVDIGLFADIEA